MRVSEHDHVEIELGVEGDAELSAETEMELFRITQEALNNAIRHANATRITVEVRLGDAMRLSVTDDGVGFDPESVAARGKRLGLTSMLERAQSLGATLAVDSAPGRGTRVIVEGFNA